MGMDGFWSLNNNKNTSLLSSVNVTVDLLAIVDNFKKILKSVDNSTNFISMPWVDGSYLNWPKILPVLKADAYGHGQEEVAKALCLAGASAFASGRVIEALELRNYLNEAGLFSTIVSLVGGICYEELDIAFSNKIIPTIHSFEQLKELIELSNKSSYKVLDIAIKFDSGMGRLGFYSSDTKDVLSLIGSTNINPVLLLSHLATADEFEGEAFVLKQSQEFNKVVKLFKDEYPEIGISLCNSAGGLVDSEITKTIGNHIVRPGLALYGIEPNEQKKCLNLTPAMTVKAPVVSVKKISKGQGVGYGLEFVAPKNMTVAVVNIGYADGLSRNLNNKGLVILNGVKIPVLGRVSMQMIAVDCSLVNSAKVGDWAVILGGSADGCMPCYEVAASWGTIPHEVLCVLGVINKRTYNK